jgi:hypothetical protein
MTNSLLRYRLVIAMGRTWHPGQCHHAQQTPQMRAAALHELPLGFLDTLKAA